MATSTPATSEAQVHAMGDDRTDSDNARLTIGTLSRATGVPVETLRTWEARYGFPAPDRRPSGHRLYPASCVTRVRRVAEAIARGHRASVAVAASEEQLGALLSTLERPAAAPRYTGALDDEALRRYLDAVVALDDALLARLLRSDYERLGVMSFLHQCVAPLIVHIGDAWHAGTLQVRHEHVFSQCVTDVLRTLRAPFDANASGALVVFATLPGERHGLGLQMAALVAASQGCRVLSLGTDTPADEIASVARQLSARAVAISVSSSSNEADTEAHLAALRQALPRRMALIVGGAGAGTRGVGANQVHVRDLDGLAAWAASTAS